MDDGFYTNPGLDNEFYRINDWWMMGFTPIQAWITSFTVFFDSGLGWQGWHSCCFGLHVVGFDHVCCDDGFYTNPGLGGEFYQFFFDFSLGWQGWHSLCCGLHVFGVSCLVNDGLYTNPGPDGEFCFFLASSLGWQGWHSLCFGLHVFGVSLV